MKFATLPHSPVGYAVEAGYLDERQALLHEDRHIVSNLVGTREMRIDLGAPYSMAPFDTLLLASDGLFDNLPAGEIVSIIRKGRREEAATRLARRCAEVMSGVSGEPSKPDDFSFVLYRAAARPRSQEGATKP